MSVEGEGDEVAETWLLVRSGLLIVQVRSEFVPVGSTCMFSFKKSPVSDSAVARGRCVSDDTVLVKDRTTLHGHSLSPCLRARGGPQELVSERGVVCWRR